MNKLSTLAVCVTILIGAVVILFNVSPTQSNLGGSNPSFDATEVVNSSSSVTAQGAVIITNASSAGRWFRVTNTSLAQAWCGFGTNTSTLISGGQYLASSASSTGETSWGERDATGAVSCWSNGTAVISYSYVQRRP